MGGVVDTLLFQPPTPPTPIRLAAATGGGRRELVWLKTVYGSKIPALFFQRKFAIYTILYSHGNAEDLGMLSGYLADLSKILHVNILAYDYTGYGYSNRQLAKHSTSTEKLPSEQHCYADICAAYDYLVRLRGTPPRHIILFGRSIGSGPSCYLATKLNARTTSSETEDFHCTSQCSSFTQFVDEPLNSLNTRNDLNHLGDEIFKDSEYIGGIILHSPFASVCRVVVDVGFTPYLDQFPNIDRIADVRCPVLIIHGTDDEVVPFKHGQMLYELIPEHLKVFQPFWAKGMGHNNIEVEATSTFVWNLMEFLQLIRRREYLGIDRFKGPCRTMFDPPDLNRAYVQRHVMLMIDREMPNVKIQRKPSPERNNPIPTLKTFELRGQKVSDWLQGTDESEIIVMKKDQGSSSCAGLASKPNCRRQHSLELKPEERRPDIECGRV